jgi:hypothetical protein
MAAPDNIDMVRHCGKIDIRIQKTRKNNDGVPLWLRDTLSNVLEIFKMVHI